LALTFICMPLVLRAQLSVEILLDQQQFLKDESMPLRVRITNRSGQTLTFGNDSDWLTFAVDSRDGFSIAKFSEVPVNGKFSLDSAEVATRTVDLMPHFDFSRPGRYSVAATLKIPQWEKEITSKPANVEVIRGVRLWQQEFGLRPQPGPSLPAAERAGVKGQVREGPPEMRKFALEQAQFRKQVTLYVRISDLPENKTFRVIPAGPTVSFNRPEAQVDRESRLHLLFQTGPHSFLYNVVSPEGERLLQQTYDFVGNSSIRLKSDADGIIYVSGGVRRLKPGEAAAAALAHTNEVNAAKP